MRRLLVTLVLVGAVAAALAGASGGDDSGERVYTIEFDNAFGLVEGGDVRVAGVNAGSVREIRLDTRSKKALVDVALTERGFGPFRDDAFCETRPQSPLGEYFVDCRVGTSKRTLPEGATLRVERTASTIPPDLVANIMRLPYRQRLRLILGELGAGLAGRPDDLNAAIRRSVPALRQTARLVNILAEHDRVIRDLVGNAETVMTALARNRRDVGRFVVEARDTASASAERAEDIRRNFDRLPHFLNELTPTMDALGQAAEEQRPVLVDLSAAAEDLSEFLDRSAELSDASRPALAELGETSVVGRTAAKATAPHAEELRAFARPLTDLAPNLRIVLEDFSDPSRAVEKDPRSPGGRGYSGAEAILRYVFSQSLVNNGFDELGYMVRAAVHSDHCSPYVDAAAAKKKSQEDCRSWLGPYQPGVTSPDPTAKPDDEKKAARKKTSRRKRAAQGEQRGSGPAPPETRNQKPETTPLPNPLEELLPPEVQDLIAPLPASDGALLDYLLG